MCTKLYSTIFNAYGEEDDAINDALQKRVEALRNLPLTPEMLDVSRKQFLLLGEEEEGGGADEGNGKPAVGDGMPTTPTSSSSNDENNNNNNKSPHQNNIPKRSTMNIQNEIEIIETMGASLSLSNESDYHFINADHEHLTIGDIKTLLISYKNLANKYEALKRGIEMKLRETRESGDSYSSLLTAAEEADDENDDEEEEEKGDVVVATTTSITTSPAAPPSLL